MNTRRLWLGLLAYWVVAAVSLVVVHPEEVDRWHPLVAAAAGAAAGGALALALSGSRPRLPPARGVALVIVGSAVAEETVWRRLVLGTLADRSGVAAALAASTIAFALAHPAGRRMHVVTGAAFGCLYVISASLVCAAAAHAVYNLALTGVALQERPAEASPVA